MRSYVFVEIGDEFRFPARVVRIRIRSLRQLVYTNSLMFVNGVSTNGFTHIPEVEAGLWGARCLLLCFEGASENITTGLSHLRCPRAIDLLYFFENVVKHVDKESAIEARSG